MSSINLKKSTNKLERDPSYLADILEATQKIEKYLESVTFNQFVKNDLVFDAVIRELEIIGEATNNLSWDTKEKYQNIPWRDIVDTRNKLIHGYSDLDSKIIWSTCQKDLPDLQKKISGILDELPEHLVEEI